MPERAPAVRALLDKTGDGNADSGLPFVCSRKGPVGSEPFAKMRPMGRVGASDVMFADRGFVDLSSVPPS